MSAMEEARLKDAIKFMHEADKNTEKSWFKKPDWDIAAQYYEKAGQSFKAGKSYEQSVQAFVKASDAMINATSLFMAGRALENAGNIALQNLGQPERASDMYKRASELYMQNMTPDRAAEMLEKSAKAMEPISVDSAIEAYVGACNIYENEDRAKYATDTYKRTISLLVKHKRFEKAVEILQRLGNVQKETINKSAYFKTLLSIIIVQLAAGDEVDAGKKFQDYCMVDGFVRSEESAVAHAMLDAFEHRDQNYYNHAANRQHVGFLDNEVARLAHNIVISNDLISSGGFSDPQQPPQGPPGPYNNNNNNGGFQSQQQAPHQNQFYQAGPPSQPQRQPSPYQPQPQQQQPPRAQDPYQNAQARPVSHGYNAQPQGHGGAPPHTGDRSDSDWQALTGKPVTPPQSQHRQQAPYQGQPQHRQQQQQQPPAPPSRNYYNDEEDDGLL